jgi:hypothetical protein
MASLRATALAAPSILDSHEHDRIARPRREPTFKLANHQKERAEQQPFAYGSLGIQDFYFMPGGVAYASR